MRKKRPADQNNFFTGDVTMALSRYLQIPSLPESITTFVFAAVGLFLCLGANLCHAVHSKTQKPKIWKFCSV
jgi:hypothetical protein